MVLLQHMCIPYLNCILEEPFIVSIWTYVYFCLKEMYIEMYSKDINEADTFDCQSEATTPCC